MPERVVVEADGGARGNPGPAGYGAVVRDPDSGDVLAERCAALGTATNNVAEYNGLIAGLSAAVDLGAREVEVLMDSKLVVEQMSGRWQIKHPALRPLAAQAAALVTRFDRVGFTWVPRERNKLADALANRAMDEARSGAGGAAGAPQSAGAARAARSWEPPATPVTRLILVRHGETALTAQHRYSGRGDPPLSARGRLQAEATAQALVARSSDVAAVVSSPLSRCTRTARPIAAALGGAPVVVDDDLIECDFGAWEGRTFAEVRERWPVEMERWLASPAVAPPGGESFRAVQKRARGAVARIREAYAGRTTVLVSHVTPIKLILSDALAAGDELMYRLYLEPAGLSIVDLWESGVAVRAVNDTGHLFSVAARG
jgi:ribonuclease H / adenosylcobalamin/alpha-ribazole phosphatase